LPIVSRTHVSVAQVSVSLQKHLTVSLGHSAVVLTKVPIKFRKRQEGKVSRPVYRCI